MDDVRTPVRRRKAVGSSAVRLRNLPDRAEPLRMFVERIGERSPPMPALPAAINTGCIWFDYTDLVHYFEDNRLPTGIQRVQIGIFRASLERGANAAPGPAGGRIAACSFDAARRCWVPLPEALLASVCRTACQASPAEETWTTLMQALRQAVATAPPVPFAPGDTLVNIGTSWWIPDYLRYVEHLQRERGIFYAPFMHDCIPLCCPEFCAAGLVDEFRDWFADAMRVADLVLANSAYTARDVAHCSQAIAGHPVDPFVIRLDARFDDGPQPGQAAAARLDAQTHLQLGLHRPFALFVATVEARKNHVFVFECWKTLIERHGDACPDLICVGKLGWLVEYTRNWLNVHPELAGRIRLIGTVSDLDLSALYRTAQFTVYCSHYEGWGLPVTESLCHGRATLIPDHTSLPEAGGSLAHYYQPGSAAEFCAGVERLMDKRERARAEAAIRARYRPRGWGEVLGEIVATVRTAPPRLHRPAPRMQPGCIYSMGRTARRATGDPGAVAGGAMLAGLAWRHGIGWHSAEDWGSWSRLPQAQLLLRLPDGDEADLLYLVVRGGPAEQTIRLQAGGGPALPVTVQANRRRLLRLRVSPAEAGRELLVTFHALPYSLAPFTDGGDPREVGIGLEALAVTDRGDAAARLDLLETLVGVG